MIKTFETAASLHEVRAEASMARAGFETVGGKKIFFINFRGCEVAEALVVAGQARSEIAKCPPASVLTLTDITDAKYDDTVTDALKNLAKSNKPFVKASAVVGVTGLRKVIYSMITMFSKRQMMLFPDLESAKKWLLTQ